MSDLEDKTREVIYARRSVRQYVENRQVEPEKITKLLDAAMAAPSACNLQPWEFIVVTEPERMQELKKTVTMGDYNAPMAIIICGNTKNIPWGDNGYQIDCGAAMENMLLMAAAMGLGSVCLGGFDEDALRDVMSIPEEISIMAVVYFGYAAYIGQPKSRYNPEAVFYQTYDASRVRPMRTIEMVGDADTVE